MIIDSWSHDENTSHNFEIDVACTSTLAGMYMYIMDIMNWIIDLMLKTLVIILTQV